jgi:hypothetical protein
VGLVVEPDADDLGRPPQRRAQAHLVERDPDRALPDQLGELQVLHLLEAALLEELAQVAELGGTLELAEEGLPEIDRELLVDQAGADAVAELKGAVFHGLIKIPRFRGILVGSFLDSSF